MFDPITLLIALGAFLLTILATAVVWSIRTQRAVPESFLSVVAIGVAVLLWLVIARGGVPDSLGPAPFVVGILIVVGALGATAFVRFRRHGYR